MAKLGQLYKPRDTVVHKLNPIAKVLIFVSTLVIALISGNYIFNYIIAALGFILLIIGRVAKEAKIVVRVIVIIVTWLFLMHGFFSPWGETALWSYDVGFYKFTLWEEGLRFANLIASRVLIMVSYGLLLVLATHPQDMITALEQKGLSRKLGFIYISFIELIPELERETDRIISAQRARGLNTEGLKNKFKSYIPLIGPLMTGALLKSSIRAMAMEVRGFSIEGKKTFFREIKMNKKDKMVMAITVSLFVLYVAMNLLGFMDVMRWEKWLF